MKTAYHILGVVSAGLIFGFVAVAHAGENQTPVSATLTTEILGRSKGTAIGSVFHIVRADGGTGTGFLHKSGRVITALHVIANLPLEQMRLITSGGQQVSITNVVADTNLDLALLTLDRSIHTASFSISTNDVLAVGTPVITWGFPGGYSGLEPLLSAGNTSGFQHFKTSSSNTIRRVVVNAAFNGGNSGGPLLDVESQTVTGVVVSKLAPIPQHIEVMIDSLKRNPNGLSYEFTDANGALRSMSEAQILAEVISYLRSQVQLVIGYAVPASDLREFLKGLSLEP